MIPAAPTRRDKLRAALLAFHVLAVIVLSLPGAQVARSARWNSRLMQKDVADWAAELGKLGIHVTPSDLQQRLFTLASGYVAIRNELVAPFDLYARVTGARQGWAMFASPQRRPAELHVDGLTAQGFRPLYRPHDPNAAFMADYFLHNRMRKFQGRFARAMRGQFYEDFTKFVAKRAFERFPEVSQVRIALYGYATLSPELVRAGTRPEGSYDNVRLFSREAQ
jgi:hypothetical protein